MAFARERLDQAHRGPANAIGHGPDDQLGVRVGGVGQQVQLLFGRVVASIVGDQFQSCDQSALRSVSPSVHALCAGRSSAGTTKTDRTPDCFELLLGLEERAGQNVDRFGQVVGRFCVGVQLSRARKTFRSCLGAGPLASASSAISAAISRSWSLEATLSLRALRRLSSRSSRPHLGLAAASTGPPGPRSRRTMPVCVIVGCGRVLGADVPSVRRALGP